MLARSPRPVGDQPAGGVDQCFPGARFTPVQPSRARPSVPRHPHHRLDRTARRSTETAVAISAHDDPTRRGAQMAVHRRQHGPTLRHVIGLENLPRPLAYVMGGGGSLGAAQVGMLKALAEVGLRPDMIVGTSVGAGNGALAAEQVAGAPARLREIWALIYRDIVFPHGARQQVKMLEPGRTYLFLGLDRGESSVPWTRSVRRGNVRSTWGRSTAGCSKHPCRGREQARAGQRRDTVVRVLVTKQVMRLPSMSVTRSWAPGCGRSRRTMTRMPGGHPVTTRRPRPTSTGVCTWPGGGDRPRWHAPLTSPQFFPTAGDGLGRRRCLGRPFGSLAWAPTTPLGQVWHSASGRRARYRSGQPHAADLRARPAGLLSPPDGPAPAPATGPGNRPGSNCSPPPTRRQQPPDPLPDRHPRPDRKPTRRQAGTGGLAAFVPAVDEGADGGDGPRQRAAGARDPCAGGAVRGLGPVDDVSLAANPQPLDGPAADGRRPRRGVVPPGVPHEVGRRGGRLETPRRSHE